MHSAKTVCVIATILASVCSTGPAHAEGGDADAGKLVFHQCQSCHSVKPGELSIGPSLYGVVGRRAGSLPAYHYSPALEKLGYTWDEDHLTAFLAAPKVVAPGNRMPFPGLKEAKDRINVVAYLQTLK